MRASFSSARSLGVVLLVAGCGSSPAPASSGRRVERGASASALSVSGARIGASAYGVPSEIGFITAREITAREVLLLDADGKLVDRWLNLSDLPEVLAAVDALRP